MTSKYSGKWIESLKEMVWYKQINIKFKQNVYNFGNQQIENKLKIMFVTKF